MADILNDKRYIAAYDIYLETHERGVSVVAKDALKRYFKRHMIEGIVQLVNPASQHATLRVKISNGNPSIEDLERGIKDCPLMPSNDNYKPKIRIIPLEIAVAEQISPEFSNNENRGNLVDVKTMEDIISSQAEIYQKKIEELELERGDFEKEASKLEEELILARKSQKTPRITTPLQGIHAYMFSEDLQEAYIQAIQDYEFLKGLISIPEGRLERINLINALLGTKFVSEEQVSISLTRLDQVIKSHPEKLRGILSELEERRGNINAYEVIRNINANQGLVEHARKLYEESSLRLPLLECEREKISGMLEDAKVEHEKVSKALEKAGDIKTALENRYIRRELGCVFPALITGFDSPNISLIVNSMGGKNLFEDELTQILENRNFKRTNFPIEGLAKYSGPVDRRKSPPLMRDYFSEILSIPESPVIVTGLTPKVMLFDDS